MADRITDKTLFARLDRLNASAGANNAYNKCWNVGAFTVMARHGGYHLQHIADVSGAVRGFGGLVTKRELVARIEGMIDGIYLAKEGK